MNLNIPQKEIMPNISVRVPEHVRTRARAIAREKGVKEGVIYRHILEAFFSGECQQTVDKEQPNDHR